MQIEEKIKWFINIKGDSYGKKGIHMRKRKKIFNYH
jgi:hypothetical protein